MNYRLTIYAKNELLPKLQRIIDFSNLSSNQLTLNDITGWLKCELEPVGVLTGVKFKRDYEHHHITIYGVLGDVVAAIHEEKEFEEITGIHKSIKV